MTYQAVNEILEDQEPETMARYASLVPMFKEMAELHQILEAMRVRRGAVSFEDREAKVLVDEAGHPQDILLRERGVGERLIESFMLAANETVAEHFNKRRLPFIYRIHEEPKEEKCGAFLICFCVRNCCQADKRLHHAQRSTKSRGRCCR